MIKKFTVLFVALSVFTSSRVINANQQLFMAAIRDNDYDLAADLVSSVDINKKSFTGQTPLHVAASLGHADCVRLLLDAGARVNETNFMAEVPLHSAVDAGDTESAQLLLEREGDIERQDKDGNTPLFRAALKAEVEVVQLLLEHGAETEIVGKDALLAIVVSKLTPVGRNSSRWENEKRAKFRDIVCLLSGYVARLGSQAQNIAQQVPAALYKITVAKQAIEDSCQDEMKDPGSIIAEFATTSLH